MIAPDFPAIIAACESATGPLDDDPLGRVVCAIKSVEFVSTRRNANGDFGVDYVGLNVSRPYALWLGERPDRSIDAAIALVERSGVRFVQMHQSDMRLAKHATVEHQPTQGRTVLRDGGDAATWPLAIIAAGLRAAQTRETK